MEDQPGQPCCCHQSWAAGNLLCVLVPQYHPVWTGLAGGSSALHTTQAAVKVLSCTFDRPLFCKGHFSLSGLVSPSVIAHLSLGCCALATGQLAILPHENSQTEFVHLTKAFAAKTSCVYPWILLLRESSKASIKFIAYRT